MSAYVVEAKTINRVVSGMLETYHYTDTHWTVRKLEELGFSRTREGQQKLAEALLEMNREAVSQRYNEEKETGPIAYRLELASPAQYYKSAQCLMYQCMEGTVPQQPLYKILADYHNAIAYKLAERYIESMPKAQRPEWA